MATLSNVDGRSLVADLSGAFNNMKEASVKQFALDREAKDIDLLRQAQGLPPLTPPVQANNGSKKQRGFLRSISPQIADHIDGLNESRDVNGIDEVRNTAQMTVETANRILAAKTPAAKQKIILESAQKARKEGRDNTQMLKNAGLTPDQMDLVAQKAKMVNEATLRTLPAPTGDERQAARAQLAIRNPQAYQTLVAEENARASKGQAAASAAQRAAEAAALDSAISAIRTDGLSQIEGSGGAGPEVQTGGPVQPTGVQGQPRGRNPARTGDPSQPLVDGMNSYLDELPAAGQEPAPVATEGFARDRGRVNPEMAPTPAMPIDPTFTQTTADPMPPQAPPVQLSPIETANGEYQDALGKWERAQDWAAETLQKAESLPPKARNALKAEVNKVVDQYEGRLGTRADQLKIAQDTAKFEADNKPELSDLAVA